MPRTRRTPRRIRRVTPGATTDLPLGEAGMRAMRVGLEATEILATEYPDFYRVHVAGLPCTLPRLWGCCMALWQLTETERGIQLDWPREAETWNDIQRDCAGTPAETLRAFEWISDEYMADQYVYIAQPMPLYAGLGIQEEDYELHDTLTLLLWWMLQDTALSPGYDLHIVAHDHPAYEDVIRIQPLRLFSGGDVDMVLRLAARDLPAATHLAQPADIFRYAFAETSNPLANASAEEIWQVHFGETPDNWAWSDLDRLAALSRDAHQIEAAYDTLASALDIRRHGAGPLRQLAARIHRAARTVSRTPRESTSLIDILRDLPADSPIQLEAV